ncbi:hypothetical protein [Pseudooceanicola aestuarii]|uniref:hypothetical protein n=1 Tax=Pseudooceanicola aestuarii TaxID=2697319 RepID=UPI0013D03FFC|nr:hypothetical protein [Pseudooceanicola aestuarii]
MYNNFFQTLWGKAERESGRPKGWTPGAGARMKRIYVDFSDYYRTIVKLSPSKNVADLPINSRTIPAYRASKA